MVLLLPISVVNRLLYPLYMKFLTCFCSHWTPNQTPFDKICQTFDIKESFRLFQVNANYPKRNDLWIPLNFMYPLYCLQAFTSSKTPPSHAALDEVSQLLVVNGTVGNTNRLHISSKSDEVARCTSFQAYDGDIVILRCTS